MTRTTKYLIVSIPVVLLALAIIIPNVVEPRVVVSANACLANLRMIDRAKQQWALAGHKTTNDVPTEADLVPFFGSSNTATNRSMADFARCPADGHYTIGSLNEPPKCSVGGIGHSLPD